MRPDALRVVRRQLPLALPYAIAGEHITAADIVVLQLQAGGLHAYGAAAPSVRLTGEDGASVLHALEHVAIPWFQDASLEQPIELLDHLPDALRTQPAARAAVDVALHDLRAKQVGAPLRRWLGSRPDDMITSVTIGICDVSETVRQGEARVQEGFACLKLKVGDALDEDVARVIALRAAVGRGTHIRVDGNEGYDAEEACRFLDAVKAAKIELLEQPVPRDDLDGLKHVTAHAGRLPVMADEAAGSVEEAHRVLECGAATALNVKLMKCGGLAPAREILRAARAHGVRCMMGCFDESRISIAAAAHLALSDDQVWWADLDGHLDLAEDVASGGVNVAAGYLSVSEQPGLGVSVSLE